ncbi:MAG: protein kinase [Synechococcales bacterium]|nr:protein kinase [Synechococcales bacterium]
MPLSAPLPANLLLENRYEVVKLLGHGGFGRTYLARDRQRFNEACVLKEFAPQLSNPAALKKAEELFEREAGTLHQLRHPQIPEFRALLTARVRGEQALFIVEQYIPGQSYSAWLDQGHCLSEADAMQLLLDLLPVLSYIHDRNIVHRDISPDNLIRHQDTGKPMLIDFGSVKQLAQTALQLAGATPSGQPSGTQIHKPGYSPREQLRGQVTASSDLYALGVTILVLLTGRSPLELFDDQQGIWRWRKFIRLQPSLERVLDRMVEIHPRDRFQSAFEVMNALQPIAGTSPGVVTMPPARHPMSNMGTQVVSPGLPQSYSSPASQAAMSPAGSVQASPIAPVAPAPIHTPQDWHWLGRSLIWLIKAPFHLIGLGVKFLWYSLRTLDWVMTWIWRLIWITMFVVLGAIVAFFWKPDWLAGRLPQLPSFPGGGGGTTEQCPDLNQLRRYGVSDREFYQRVNDRFHQRRPELGGRMLTDRSEDAPLRQEWCAIATTVMKEIEK